MNNTIRFSLTEPELLSQYKEFFFDEYNYYFNEREKLKKEIIFALNDKTVPYPIKNWFRLIGTKYAINPLSGKGSIENAIGGRFNIGKIKEGRFPVFPAIYLGKEKKTCIKEVYEGMEQFFSSPEGNVFFRVSGYVNSVLDITKKGSLDKFLKIIKTIRLSQTLKNRANKLRHLENRKSLQNITQLKKQLYNKNWRREPSVFDVPAPSQIFGRLAKDAGIEAVIYKSTKQSRSGLCMAVFPENFKNSDSYLVVEDCPKDIINKKMDSETYESFY